jgi:hypothetical protein
MRVCHDMLVGALAVGATGSRDAAVLGTFIQAVAPHIHTARTFKVLMQVFQLCHVCLITIVLQGA